MIISVACNESDCPWCDWGNGGLVCYHPGVPAGTSIHIGSPREAAHELCPILRQPDMLVVDDSSRDVLEQITDLRKQLDEWELLVKLARSKRGSR